MEGEARFFLFPSRDVQELLASYQTDIIELLRREGLDVAHGYAADPAAHADAPEREPVSVIILASAALAAVLTPTISRIISELAHRRALVTEAVSMPVEDSQGRIVQDKNGQPIMHWVDRSRFVETSRTMQPTEGVNVEGLGIKILLGAVYR